MAKKPPRGNAKGDPAAIPGIKRASEIELTPQQQAAIEAKRIIELRSATAPPDPKEFTVSASAAARQIGISNSTLRRYVREDNVPHLRVGKGELARFKLRPSDVEAMASKLTTVHSADATPPMAIPDDADAQTNPIIAIVAEERPELFKAFTSEDWREIYSLHGDGGALTRDGVVKSAKHINAKRDARHKFEVVLESEHAETLIGIVDTLYRQATARR